MWHASASTAFAKWLTANYWEGDISKQHNFTSGLSDEENCKSFSLDRGSALNSSAVQGDMSDSSNLRTSNDWFFTEWKVWGRRWSMTDRKKGKTVQILQVQYALHTITNAHTHTIVLHYYTIVFLHCEALRCDITTAHLGKHSQQPASSCLPSSLSPPQLHWQGIGDTHNQWLVPSDLGDCKQQNWLHQRLVHPENKRIRTENNVSNSIGSSTCWMDVLMIFTTIIIQHY